MIQLNLLPDVKLEYIKAQQTRRLVLTVSVLVTAGAIAILLLTLFVDVAQKVHLKDLSNDIRKESSTLQSKPQINKILTVQNQLESLTTLHASKPAANNLFNYLNEVTPVKAAISSFNIDFTQQTAIITGTADTLASVNTYVDTLKFTTYSTDNNAQSAPAFTNVVLTSFALSSATDGAQAATYTITMSYDKNIFDVTQNVKLSVPSQTTTRSALSQSTALFQASPTNSSKAGGQ